VTDLRKTVRRRVDLIRGSVTVSLYPGALIGFRERRRRVEYVLPLARVFLLAADAYAQQQRAEKKAARIARRAAR